MSRSSTLRMVPATARRAGARQGTRRGPVPRSLRIVSTIWRKTSRSAHRAIAVHGPPASSDRSSVWLTSCLIEDNNCPGGAKRRAFFFARAAGHAGTSRPVFFISQERFLSALPKRQFGNGRFSFERGISSMRKAPAWLSLGATTICDGKPGGYGAGLAEQFRQGLVTGGGRIRACCRGSTGSDAREARRQAGRPHLEIPGLIGARCAPDRLQAWANTDHGRLRRHQRRPGTPLHHRGRVALYDCLRWMEARTMVNSKRCEGPRGAHFAAFTTGSTVLDSTIEDLGRARPPISYDGKGGDSSNPGTHEASVLGKSRIATLMGLAAKG